MNKAAIIFKLRLIRLLFTFSDYLISLPTINPRKRNSANPWNVSVHIK